MQLDYIDFDKEKKKLKRYPAEKEILGKIIIHIKSCKTYQELKFNALSKIYGFEELKHELAGYSSFRLGKNGVIRLIIKVDIEKDIVYFRYISLDHYDDFKRRLRKGM